MALMSFKSSDHNSDKKSLIRPLTLSWAALLLALGGMIVWTNMMGEEAQKQLLEQQLKERLAGAKEQVKTAEDTPQGEISIPVKTSDNPPVTASNETEGQAPNEKNNSSAESPSPEELTIKISGTHDEPTIGTQNSASKEKQIVSLSAVPHEGLIITGKEGPLPVLGPDGLKAFEYYARPFEDTSKLPRIAILVKGIALNSRSSQMAIDSLPPEIDMAISPYGRNMQDWVQKSRDKGHEVFLMLPMEPLSYPKNDPGPHTLMASYSARDNIRRLEWILSRFTGYVGVVNDMGSRFTANDKAVKPIVRNLHDRGLMVFDGRTTRYSRLAKEAKRIGMPRVINTRYIDNEVTKTYIEKRLKELENTARTYGSSVGIMNSYPISIRMVNEWAATLKEKGFQLVPITAVANRQVIN